MAKLFRQHPSAHSVYDVSVESIEQARRNQVRESGTEQYGASLLGRLLTDLKVSNHTQREAQHRQTGESGEQEVVEMLVKKLPPDWALFTPFVIFPRPGDYAQLDHLLIGPPGLWIIETKAWQGSFLGKRDAWSRRMGNEWVPCDSPTHQLSRHLYWLRQWLKHHTHPDLPRAWEPLTHAAVLFTQAKWVQAFSCAFPFFHGVEQAIESLTHNKERHLTTAHITHLLEAMTAPPLPIHKSATRPTAATPAPDDIPHCPLCRTPMVKRTAKKGQNAGNAFWGCPRYPNCRQILPIDASL